MLVRTNNTENKVSSALEMINQLDSIEKDVVYRTLWQTYVEQDLEKLAIDRDVNLSKDDFSVIASRFVWDGDYDCNLPYWNNLSNLLDEYQC